MTNPPSRPTSPDPGIFSVSDGEVRAWIDGGIHLKAVTEFGDPVELSGAEAHEVVVALLRLISDLDETPDHKCRSDDGSTTGSKKTAVAVVDLGFSVADADVQELAYNGVDLVIRLRDWRERAVEYHFVDTLAFRWSGTPSLPTPRDDECYVALDSEWLRTETRADGVAASNFAHYLLCFNAAKVLEVVGRRCEPRAVKDAPR